MNSKSNILSIFAEDKESMDEMQEIINADKNTINQLIINHSSMSSIKGLQLFETIVFLDLSSNYINNLPTNFTINLKKLKTLNLSCNYLSSLNGVEGMINLEEADFSHNKIVNIESLSVLSEKSNKFLKKLKLEDNLISSINQLHVLIK